MQRLQGKKAALRDNEPQEALKKILTKKELQHIKFNNFKKGVLSFHVDSSAWLYNFNLQKQDLITRFNKQLANLKDIRFYMGDAK